MRFVLKYEINHSLKIAGLSSVYLRNELILNQY